jgi:hypothetical protein
MQVRATENEKEFGKCGCGRSPTGKCIGWHGLTEEMYAHQKMLWLEEQERNDNELAEYQKQAQELWNDSCTAPRKDSK